MSATVSPPTPRLSLLSRNRLEALLQASQAFNSTIDLDALLPRLLEMTLSVTESEAGALWVSDGGEVRCTHAVGDAAARLTGQPLGEGHGAVAEALRTRAPVVDQDVLDDPRFAAYRGEPDGFRPRSAVTIPLVAGAECLGAIELVNDVGGKDQFDEADVAFLESLADDAAAALRNARLFEAERRARDLKALLEVSHEITSSFDLDRVLVSIVNLAGRAVRFDRCTIAVWERDRLRVRAISGEDKLDARSETVGQVESLLVWTAEKPDALDVRDVHAADRDAATLRTLFGPYIAGSGSHALLVLPIADAEGELGRLLFEFHSPGALQDWMREAAELLADVAALAIRNAQLYADVPFIGILEPLAQKRRVLLALPRSTQLRYGVLALAVIGALVFVRLPVRVTAQDATVHAAAQRPARAGASGVVAEIFVRDGDRVTAGTPIARLRNEDLLVRASTTEGELRLARQQHLAAEARGDAAGAAAAHLASTQLGVAFALLQEESASLIVRAQTSGIVLTPRLEEQIGSYLEQGEPVAWIGDADWSEVRVRVAQHDVGAIRADDRIRVRVAARPEVRFEGRVQAITPLAETVDGQPLYTVRALLDNRDDVLRAGMAARARILGESRPLGYLLLRRPWRWIRMNLWW